MSLRSGVFCASHEQTAFQIRESAEFAVLVRDREELVSKRELLEEARLALDSAGIELGDLTIDQAFHRGGSEHQVKRLFARTLGGRAVNLAMRFSPPGTATQAADYDNVESLVSWKCETNGIPTPTILADSTEFHPTDAPSYNFTVMEFAGGVCGHEYVQESPESALRLARHIGKSLAQLHRVGIEGGFGFFDETKALEEGLLVGRHASYAARLQDGMDNSLESLMKDGHLTVEDAAQLRKLFTNSNIAQKIGAESPVLLHGDLGPHNLMVDPVTIFDFGETQAGPPLHDLAISSNFLAYYNLEDLVPELLNAYTEGGGILPDNPSEQLAFLRARVATSQATAYSAIDKVKPNAHNTQRLQTAKDLLSV